MHALTPQAKGRVERASQTLQDRLVKKMRLLGIRSMKANAFVPAFIELRNAKFAVVPREEVQPTIPGQTRAGPGNRLGTP